MKNSQYLLSILGAAALALSMNIAKPMTAYFDGQTGKLVRTEIVNESKIDWSKAVYLNHACDINNVGASGMQVLQQPLRKGDLLIIDIWW